MRFSPMWASSFHGERQKCLVLRRLKKHKHGYRKQKVKVPRLDDFFGHPRDYPWFSDFRTDMVLGFPAICAYLFCEGDRLHVGLAKCSGLSTRLLFD